MLHCPKSKYVYRLFFVIISGICVGIHFNVNDKYYNAHSFSYFTVWSNILCLVVTCVILIKDLCQKDTCIPPLIYFKGMALSAIICAFLVYHFGECRIKYPLQEIGIFGLPATTLLSHYIVPFLFLLDWILFQPKGHFKLWYICSWLAFPLLYFLSFISRCICNSPSTFKHIEKYPYYFLDYETLGLRTFCTYILLMIVIMLAENTIIVFVDYWLVSKKQSSKI